MRKMYRHFESLWFGLAASVAVRILSVLKTPRWLAGQNAVEGAKKHILHISGYEAQRRGYQGAPHLPASLPESARAIMCLLTLPCRLRAS